MTYSKVVYKWNWVWNFEKEEAWLNKMAEEGWVLKSMTFIKYTFEKTQAGEYIIRMENHERDDDYLAFMEDINAEYIDSYMNWHYFKRKKEFGKFDIFSDLDGRIKHLDRIINPLIILSILNLISAIYNIFTRHFVGILNLLAFLILLFGVLNLKSKKNKLEEIRKIQE